MKRVSFLQSLLLTFVFLLTGCFSFRSSTEPMPRLPAEQLQSFPPHGVYYEIFVRTFADSDGDGIGDLNGVISKLDYLEALGIEGIWFMPINPSPSYHGYDVTDYYGIHEDYGTIEDMKRLVEEARKRDIKIIVDFVLNHSSVEHPWFEKALLREEPYRNFYVWANDSTNINEKGEWGQSIWHERSGQIYEGVFWDGMPDLNYDSPELKQEMLKVGAYWLEQIGVDGFRLDAAKHIYGPHQYVTYHGRNVEFWTEFKEEMERINSDVLLVGEVWDEAIVVVPYLTGLHSTFNFDLSAAILDTVKGEADSGIVDLLKDTYNVYSTVNPDFIDSTFITNHDMERVMSEVRGDVQKAKMAASILLTLPGNPFIYYGEEIGMEGRKPDEYIREPFVWTIDGRADHQTKYPSSKYNRDTRKKALEAQIDDTTSIFNHYKNMIYARRASEALIKGNIDSSTLDQDGLLSFYRQSENDSVFVVHNLTKKVKTIEINQDYPELHYATFIVDEIGSELEIPAYSTIILKK